jgi:hypothetical protein
MQDGISNPKSYLVFFMIAMIPDQHRENHVNGDSMADTWLMETTTMSSHTPMKVTVTSVSCRQALRV